MVPLAVAGTLLWLLLGLVFLALRGQLADAGKADWIAICFAGAGLGVVGIALMAVHDRNRVRRTSSPTSGES
jgi:Protein of unknown function (DUF2530)